jgi:hypothetical protein
VLLLASAWTFGWEALVALGTIGLAVFTAGLGWVALQQITLQRRAVEAATKPHVFPAPPRGWGDDNDWRQLKDWRTGIPVTNGGPGVALNVTAQLRWSSAGGIMGETMPTSIGPGESATLALRYSGEVTKEWESVQGLLYYSDAPGALWETEFRVYGEGGRYLVEVKGTRMLKRADGSIVEPGG